MLVNSILGHMIVLFSILFITFKFMTAYENG